MHDKAKQHRGDAHKHGKPDAGKAAKKPHEEAQKAPDMPALGGAGDPLAGGVSDQANAAENDQAQQAADQAELARLKSLPAGSPELESYKKPEALNAKVPEGNANTAGAKADSQGMSPKNEQQGSATVGPNAQQVKTERGGDKVEVKAEQLYAEPPSTGPAAEAVSNAQSGAPAATKPTEKAATPAQAPAQDTVAKEDAEKKQPQAPTEAKPESTAAETKQAGNAEPAPAPVATPESPEKGDAMAEAAGAAQPEKSPEKSPERVAGAPASAPEGKAEQAAEQQIAGPAQVADLAGNAAAPSDVQGNLQAVPEGKAEKPAEAAVPDQIAGKNEQVGASVVAPVAGANAAAPIEAAPAAQGAAAAPQAQDQKPANAAEAAIAEVAGAAPKADPAGDVGKADAAPKAGAEGPQPEQATAGSVGEVAAAVETADKGDAGAGPQSSGGDATAAQPQLAAEDTSAAPSGGGDAGGAQPVQIELAPEDAGDVQGVAEPAAEGGALQPVGATAEPAADANAPGELTDPFAGRDAAAALGSQVFGLTADNAETEAQQAPAGQNEGHIEAVANVGQDAGLDPNSLMPDVVNEQKKQLETLFNAADAGKQMAGKGGLPGFGGAGDLKGMAGKLDQWLGKGDDLLSKGKELLDKGTQMLGDTGKLLKDAGGFVKGLGSGKGLPGEVRKKAEKALGMDFGDVKVFGGDEAQKLADQFGASAFAAGKDIVMGAASKMGDSDQALVLAEELVHVAQMKGKGAAERGAKGVSLASDRAEKAARTAASKVLAGAEVDAKEYDGEARALYRNTGGAPDAAAGPEMPTSVTLSIAGKSTTVKLPKLTPGTTSKMVTLPALNVKGLSFESQARFKFDQTTGKFTGGTAYGSIAVGDVITLQDSQVTIDQSGAMKGSFPGATFKVGSLINDTITATVGAGGVTGQGTYQYSQLRGSKLDTWLKSGSMQISVAADANVTGSGSLGIEVGDFSAGNVKATIADKTLGGTVTIDNKNSISLGKAAVSTGTLTGPLTTSDKVALSGSLKLDIPSLTGGKGTVQAKWDSEGNKISGQAAYESTGSATWGKIVFTKASVTGEVADQKMSKMSGSGTAVYDALFKGNWNGSIDLDSEKADFELGGELVAPIVQGEVQVSKGALTIKVEQNELKSTAGKVDFKLGSFLKGTAVLEEGTNANTINATATTELVSAQTFDGITLSKGSIVLQVRGPSVKTVSGSVDVDYKGVAQGKLSLTESAEIRRFSGSGKANLKAPLQWGDIKVLKGSIDLSLKNNVVDRAQGQMKIGYLEKIEGQMSFDATKDFTAISGTATSALVKPWGLTAPLELQPDAGKKFNLEFLNSTFKQFSGAFSWKYEKFKGDVNVTTPLQDFGLITGTGKADLTEDLPIGTAGTTKLMGKPSSTLTGKIEQGRFIGVSGTLKWEYDAFLAGTANIAEPRTSIQEIDGMLNATVIAAKHINDKVEIQPGGADALKIELSNSVATRYQGKLDYKYDGFLSGGVTVAGQMLNFSTLAGTSQGTVYAKKTIKNVDVLEGSTLNVTFADSTFTEFAGSVNFIHKDWLKGTATAVQGGGSSMTNGVVGDLTGTLLKTPPGGSATGFKYMEGGSVKSKLVAGLNVTTFDAGSQVNWKFDDWLGGKLTLQQQSTVLRADGTDPAANLLKEKPISADQKVVFLPSQVGVELVNGQPAKYMGSVAARYQDWIKGTFKIAESSGAQNFDGDLTGALTKAVPLTGTPVELQEGGAAVIHVASNVVDGIKGTLEFKYGEGDKWLQGTVASATSTGAGITNISGNVTGKIITQQTLANMDLKTGGSIETKMENSRINKLGGTVNYQFGAGTRWIAGTIKLDNATSQPRLLTGTHESNIVKEYQASTLLKLQPSSGLTGKVEQNDVKTIAGQVAWKYDSPSWLAGTIPATEAEPAKVSGVGDASIIANKDVIPGKLVLIPGGGFTAKITNGDFTSFTGDVPIQWEDWFKGTVHVTDGTRTELRGQAKGTVIGAGKQFGTGAFGLKLLPGGSLTSELTANGIEKLNGDANAEYGQPNDGTTWHVKGTMKLQDTTASTVKGDFSGAFASPLKFNPNPYIQRGGAIKFHVDGQTVTQPYGDVNYTFKRGNDGDFLKGTATIDASSTQTNVNAQIHGTVVQKVTFGAIDILPGGQLDGTLRNNTQATLGGNLAFQYGTYLKGTLKIAGQINPDEAKVSGEATATTLTGKQLGPFNVGAGSNLGVKIENATPTQLWGSLKVTTPDLSGSIEVPQGSASTPDQVSGDANAMLKTDKLLGDGFYIKGGTSIQAGVEKNDLKSLKGSLAWRWEQWVGGTLNAQTGSTLTQVSGDGNAMLLKKYSVGATGLNILAGSGVAAKVVNNKLDSVSGTVLWSYDATEWLVGDFTLPAGTKLDSPSGTANARLAKDKVFAPVLLKQGGSLQADIVAGKPTTFQGKVLWAYPQADGWLEGDVTLAAGSKLESLNGSATARLAKDKEIATGLLLLKGGNVVGTMTNSAPSGFTGDVNWKYETWLEGKVHVEASDLKTIQGSADAHLVESKMVAEGFELQKGGQAKVTVGASAFKTFTGEVNWKYSEGEPIAQGSVKVSAESAWNSITGQADAQLVNDIQAASDLKLLKEGSNLKVNIAQSRVKDFGGQIGFLYGDDAWLKGLITVDNGSTAKKISGTASAAVVKAHPVEGTELTIMPGSNAKVTVANNDVKSFSGTLNFKYGEDPWLKGQIKVAEGASAKKISGEISASLSKYKRISDEIKFMEGGSLKASFDGSSVKQFSGNLTMGYEDWLLGELKIENSSLEDVTGSVKASLRKHKEVTQDLMLKMGGSVELKLANSKMLSFSGDVNWSYQQWLEGSMKVENSTGKELSGTASATIIQQKIVGDSGKLEIQRGSSIQAQFNASKVTGVAGDLAWRYDGWLKGTVGVPQWTKLEKPGGTITAGLLADKQVGQDLTLKRGGSVSGTMTDGSVKKISGSVEWGYQGWLGGTVDLQPSDPAASLTGKATATVIQAKEVKAPVTIDRGGSLTLEFDSKKSMAQQPFSANLAWWYEKWLGGNVEVTAGSTFDNLNGKADAQLKDEKVYDKLTLRRGGQLRAVFAASKPDSFGGDLNWQYESWIGGTVKVNDGSKLSAISGQAAASLLEDKQLANDFSLQAGGHAQVTLASNKVDSFGGTVFYKWKGWIDGSVDVQSGSKIDKISGKATAHLSKDYAVNGSEFVIKQGTSLTAVVAENKVDSLSGTLGWRYQKWAEGNLEVQSSKLDSVSGNAQARVVTDQPLGASGLKLTPGGSLQAEVKNNSLTSFGGSINIQYKELAKGNLTIEGKTADLKTVNGSAEARLISDYPLGQSGVKLLNGSGIGVKVKGGSFDSFSGLVRFQYKDQIVGAIELTDSKPDNINGSATAQVMKDFSPTGGQFFLTQGGNLRTEFKNSSFDTVEGEVTWRYDNPSAKLDGRLTIPRSQIKSISGEGTARLLADTAPVQNTQLLAGGHLSVKVEANSPKSLTGRVDWKHSNWIGGYVELLEGTNVTGPFKGKAGASLLAEKSLGGKFTLLKGGNVELNLDSTQPVENQQISGMIAVQYDNWLKGSLTVDAGTTFKNIAGTAKVELMADKDLGSSGVKLLQGGNVQAKFSTKGLDSFGGVVMVDYQQWLGGSINVNTGSTPDAITGSITAQLTKEKGFGEFKLQPGGQVHVDVANSKLGGFGGVVNWQYQDWVNGTLTVDQGAKFESIGGQGSASIIATHPVANGRAVLQPGGHARVKVADSKLSTFSGEVNVKVDNWLDGAITVTGESTLKSLDGNAHLRIYGGDKDIGGQVKLKDGSGFQASMVNSEVTNISGTLGFSWKEFVGGSITVNSGSTLKKISGSATVSLLKDQDLAGGVKLVKGGSATIDFDGASVKSVQGQLALMYDSWLQGTVTANAGSTFESISGTAELSVKAQKDYGKISIKQGSFLAVDFAANKITEFRGNVEVGFEDWLKGNLNFKAQDLNSISGTGSLNVTQDHKVGGPVSILGGSYIRANFEKSDLKDFGGTISIGVKDWGKGTLTVNDGSTTKEISGSGQIELTQPKPLGSYVTITRAMIGATLEKNEIKSIYGEAQGEVKEFGTGWLRIDKSSTLTEFDGQAGLKLTTPRPIGNFAELSGGQIIANFQKNSLKDFGGYVDIKVNGWGKGNVTIDAGSTMDYIKGSATLTLTEPKTIGGIVKITGGSVSATVDGQHLTKMAGSIDLQIKDDVKGSLQGSIDVETQKVSGQGKLTQMRPWTVGPLKIQDASLSATVTDNKLTGASGKATIDAGKYGRGGFDINYENVGDTPKYYGSGWVEFQPHDRIKGKLTVNLSRDQKFTGEGTVNVKISDKINGMVGVALDEQGHVKLKGSVTIPGPFELFKPAPYKKDINLLDLSFVVYTPPTVKVKVGAGLGIEAGIKPLTISNIVLGGEVDLMEPEFASMSVSAHLASSAYVDLNAYIQGSVAVSAAVVAVEAGLRAALNLHLEAALSADPTITVNRNGLAFDMPVDARLSAALNLILTFFAKVRVGLDVGLFSIMKTVWEYDASPDPIRLAEMAIGAKGRVKADGSGFSATMDPEYQPPDLSLDTLKRALHID